MCKGSIRLAGFGPALGVVSARQARANNRPMAVSPEFICRAIARPFAAPLRMRGNIAVANFRRIDYR